ncbi:histo-blood group ABO system transferase 2-like [Vidua macroura]|uniref:histo-blood group ABO system transferase 2-like n=1 Tax=Vidua macroura TaxID=187451 RepID=UPI0023A87998|nr:histo-blood group ABO system transferase 2-like [Vidua macroura]
MRITKLHGLAILVTAGITGAIWYHHPFSPARAQEHEASPGEDSVLKSDLHEISLMFPWRRDVLVLTPWLAPIVWEGTFSRDILNAQYLQKNVVTGVVTFAVEKYVQFIEGFMSSANKYFLAGHPVNFYLFTDNPEKISHLQMAPENHLVVIPVQNDPRWQHISRTRMDIISSYIQSQFQHEVDYLYFMDIDVQLLAHIGVEIIDALVATISSWQVTPQHENNASEAHPESQSAIPEGQGEFYYTASFYGGSVPEVYKLTRACSAGLMEDTENGMEAPWHHERHLNRYLLQHRPTRLLSPEYYWDPELSSSTIQVKRMCPVRQHSQRQAPETKNVSLSSSQPH